MTDTIPLSPVEIRALEAVATYQLVTAKLLQLAGVGRDLKHLRAALGKLAGHKLIHARKAAWGFGLGQSPALYMLTPKGEQALAELKGENAPGTARRRMTEGVENIRHWLGVAEWHIRLRRWAEAEGVRVDWVVTEYSPAPGLKRATQIEWGTGERYTPDAIAQVMPRDGDGSPRLLVLEYYRGAAGHALKQLDGLRRASTHKTVETHFNAPRAARYMVIFDTPELRDTVHRKWPDPSSEDWRPFFSKTLAELDPFNSGWALPAGDPRPLLPAA